MVELLVLQVITESCTLLLFIGTACMIHFDTTTVTANHFADETDAMAGNTGAAASAVNSPGSELFEYGGLDTNLENEEDREHRERKERARQREVEETEEAERKRKQNPEFGLQWRHRVPDSARARHAVMRNLCETYHRRDFDVYCCCNKDVEPLQAVWARCYAINSGEPNTSMIWEAFASQVR